MLRRIGKITYLLDLLERYGTTNAYELEAMEPADLIAMLRGASPM
jgi:hypothetical protein